MRVLVVDDNVDAADLLVVALTASGYDCLVANDPHAAIRLACDRLPDIALLDIGMPEMDGYELAGHLQRQASLAGLLIVALTGYGQLSDRERSRAAGFAAHLVKPIELSLLLATFDALLGPEPA